MGFTKREALVVVTALAMLESKCHPQGLDYWAEKVLEGIPQREEVRALIDSFEFDEV